MLGEYADSEALVANGTKCGDNCERETEPRKESPVRAEKWNRI